MARLTKEERAEIARRNGRALKGKTLRDDNPTAYARRFHARVQKGEPDECWPWTGARHGKGYGMIKTTKGTYLAHREALRLHDPDAWDESLYVLHSCDNPPCCNPAHLRQGTNQDNVDDRQERGRTNPLRGENHPSAKLTADDVRAIRERRRQGESAKDLAKEYGISEFYVYAVARGDSWKALEAQGVKFDE